MSSNAEEINNCSKEDQDLVQNVHIYLTEGKYPRGASINEKRVIRRKSKKFSVRDGERFYWAGGSEPT